MHPTRRPGLLGGAAGVGEETMDTDTRCDALIAVEPDADVVSAVLQIGAERQREFLEFAAAELLPALREL
jgi:hypothetical protein